MRVLTCTCVLLVLFAPLAPLRAARLDPQDQALVAAHGAFESQSKARMDALLPKLNGHALEPYAEYWRLFLHLPGASTGEVGDFLARYPDTVLAEQLRGDWLKVLGKSGRWELFDAEYPALASDDPEVSCYALLARWKRGDAGAVADFKLQWSAPRELPEGCVTLAAALRSTGQLGGREAWERFRILVGADLLSATRRHLQVLPRDQHIDPRQLVSIFRAPGKFFRKPQVDLARIADRELVIAALTQLAGEDPRAAASFWSAGFADAFPAEDRGYVWLMLAMRGARRHLPEALDWFGAVGARALTDEQLAWRARIALRSQKWAEVRSSIDRMSVLGRNDPAWIYWYGRAELALGNPRESEGHFQRIAGEHHFYGRLAAEELGLAFRIPSRAPLPTEEEIAEVAAVPGLKRALALYRVDLRSDATREWLWTIRGMDDRRLLAAAELARRNEVWDRAIGTADRTVAAHDFSVRYLAPYRELLAEQARTRDLEEPWVLGLIRQESRFISVARSPAGATGLMQVMRDTARWVAQRTRMKDFSWARASEPNLNAALGTYYLRHVLDQFDGNPVIAAAAYNAGPTRARQWRGAEPIEGAIFAETIPFAETRDYVKKVMANTFYYAAVLGGQPTPLKTRLGMVPARPGRDVVAMQGAQSNP
jgi:soluble lytic murein transglycosylase